jgi:hypothetical protein
MTRPAFTRHWRIVPASVAGPHHSKRAIPCQDSFDTAPLVGGGQVFAVADGAGGPRYTHSAHGARLAVEAAIEAAEWVFDGRTEQPQWWATTASPQYAQACLRAFDAKLRAVTEARSRTVGDAQRVSEQYATTLLAAVAFPPFLCFVSVGDGFLVVDREPGGPQLLVPPPMVGDSMNETTFLTSSDRDADLRAGVLVDRALCGIALCTDGMYEGMLTVAKGRDGRPVPLAPPEFRNYFRFFADDRADAGELSRKLGSREFARTSGDDKTMVLAVLT